MITLSTLTPPQRAQMVTNGRAVVLRFHPTARSRRNEDRSFSVYAGSQLLGSGKLNTDAWDQAYIKVLNDLN